MLSVGSEVQGAVFIQIAAQDGGVGFPAPFVQINAVIGISGKAAVYGDAVFHAECRRGAACVIAGGILGGIVGPRRQPNFDPHIIAGLCRIQSLLQCGKGGVPALPVVVVAAAYGLNVDDFHRFRRQASPGRRGNNDHTRQKAHHYQQE